MQNTWRVTFLTKEWQKLIREYLYDNFDDLWDDILTSVKRPWKDLGLEIIKIEKVEEEIRTVWLCTEIPDIPPYKYPWTITYWEVKPHTHWWKKKGLCTDNYNDNIILCNNRR